ncbi:MAG: hypothetical protein RAO75_08500 [Candidatus Chlorobium antarcticum]|jgi:hypothetical protein|nr:hypothetical protein [Candidatus Chlorobium antarcticum]
MHAEKHLFATTPLIGKFLRKRAVDRFFSGGGKEATVALARAVEESHPESDAIFLRLLQLLHGTEPHMHKAVWNYWKTRRFEELRKRAEASEALHAELLRALDAMPESDWGNSLVFMLWSIVDGDDIAEQIELRGKHAPALEMDALFGLSRGNPERYLSLEDPDFSIFEKAWLAASIEQRQRISTTVLKSLDLRLIAAYDQAVKEGHDPELVIEAFKLCGDHDALFDRLEGLPFSTVLAVVAFWEESGGEPIDSGRKEIVRQAVALYRELSRLPEAPQSSCSKGTREIFSYWSEQELSDEDLFGELVGPEPFSRAGALFHGTRRGLIPRERLREIALNGTWPEKLVLQHLFPEACGDSPPEHVCWLQPQENIAAGLLAIRLPGSLEESRRLIEGLNRAPARKDQPSMLQQKLLQLLSLLQGHFLRGLITVDSNDDAKEINAVETEDLADGEW